MKKTLHILYITILISNLSFSQIHQIEKNSIKYFDENYNQISQTEFNNKKERIGIGRLLSIQGDSINHKILSIREKQGTIKNRKILDSLLTFATSNKIDSSKTIVIIYYPGKDCCNSSGSATKSWIKRWHKKLENKLFKITHTKPIYVYKDKEGIEKYDGIMTWYEDPDKTIENLFFKYHYPCRSFVVISEKGEYISYFGEFPKEFVWKTAKILTKK